MNILNLENTEFNQDLVFYINDYEADKITKVVNMLNKKYEKIIMNIYNDETNTFNFNDFRKLINYEKNIILSIIKDVIGYYKNNFHNLSSVFLTGSYARGTNKIFSDIDLHFLYEDNVENYIYEEIVCYILSLILKKNRDSIDPTFILNIYPEKKEIITNEMDKNDLNIYLKSSKNIYTYSYISGKKRRFYLQYLNSRNIVDLKKYIICEINNNNYEYNHCFNIIYDNNSFEKEYNEILKYEKNMINKEYIKNKIKILINTLKTLNIKSFNNISSIKKKYQSKYFEIIFEYVSIIRLQLIDEGLFVKYLNLFEIYDILKKRNEDISIFETIYKYIWLVRNLAYFCYKNEINFGLHNYDLIRYDLKDLDNCWAKLKIQLINKLEIMEDI